MRYLLFFVLLCSTAIVAAQDKNLTSFGFKGGLNRSIVNGFELDGTKTGFAGLELYGGFFVDSELNARWRFENELLFSWTDDYYFIEIPLHLKYCFVKRAFVLLGPKLDMIASNDSQIYDFNNFGVSIELGIQYKITNRIMTEIRYSKGLMKQINDYALEIYDGKRNTLRLGLGFVF